MSVRCALSKLRRSVTHRVCSSTTKVRSAVPRRLSSAADAPLKRTALYEAHLALGGKMVPFAGYEMPVQYKDGVMQNHQHVRTSAGLFDVSHMGQLRLIGKDRVKFLEKLVVADVAALENNQAQLSLITNERGGIKDDTIITKREEHLALVVNGACKDADMAHIQGHIEESKMDVHMEYLEDRALLALQGPKAASVLARLLDSPVDVAKWPFMYDKDLKVMGGVDITVSRCGYTGEDGFEISVSNKHAVALWELLVHQQEVLPSGLGARDSLRLEAGLCLYGHDLNEDTTPVEAVLAWTIGKRRKEEGGFLGYERIKQQLDDKKSVARKRVGLLVKGAPAREGAEILDADGKEVGVVTSGTFSPSLKRPISMGYVDRLLVKSGTQLEVVVRGKKQEATVAKMPFVEARYHKVE